jgi:hypothetical protein
MRFDRVTIEAAAALSIASALIAWLLARRVLLHLPADVLCADAAPRTRTVGRTLFGVSLIVLGVFLLFLPGPGVLLILVGVASCDLPGRARLLRWILRRPKILAEVNAFRTRHARAPFQEPAPGPPAVS